jgi:U3 small nucleolar RNA-associated protein 13
MSSCTQVVSSGSDGLIKVWNTHDTSTDSCVATFGEEQHSFGGKIWALDVARDGDLIVSGGSDGSVVLWKDDTKEHNLANIREKQRQTELKQQMDNLILKVWIVGFSD